MIMTTKKTTKNTATFNECVTLTNNFISDNIKLLKQSKSSFKHLNDELIDFAVSNCIDHHMQFDKTMMTKCHHCPHYMTALIHQKQFQCKKTNCAKMQFVFTIFFATNYVRKIKCLSRAYSFNAVSDKHLYPVVNFNCEKLKLPIDNFLTYYKLIVFNPQLIYIENLDADDVINEHHANVFRKMSDRHKFVFEKMCIAHSHAFIKLMNDIMQ